MSGIPLSYLFDKPILGIRRWRVTTKDGSPYLMSSGLAGCLDGTSWPPGRDKEAECIHFVNSHPHNAPAPNCRCGLYAYYTYELSRRHDYYDREAHSAHIYGVISAWGDPLIMHEFGFRAQCSRVEAIVVAHETVPLLGMEISIMDAYLDISNTYDVPLIGIDDIEDFGRSTGLAVLDRQHQPPPEHKGGLVSMSDCKCWACKAFRGGGVDHRQAMQGIESQRLQATVMKYLDDKVDPQESARQLKDD